MDIQAVEPTLPVGRGLATDDTVTCKSVCDAGRGAGGFTIGVNEDES